MEPTYELTKEELVEFKKFWTGKTGEKYIGKIKRTKEQLLDAAMYSLEPNQAHYHAAVANGLDSILKDIDALINNTEKKDDKEANAKDAK